ncbi:MAG: DUF3667 domain-containing protein [Alphaproteobacteria bacterium]|nr:DUF3667 domain-containing protein [Alphaproteobacteria bacterium]
MDELEAILETSAVAAVEVAASAMADRGHQVGACPNCGKPMIGAFCAVCGQPRDIHRRSVWGLVKVLVEDIVSFDSRILRTGFALVSKPGELALAFREGRTQRYLPALRLYLFTSLVFFLILGFTNTAIMQLQVVATPQKIVWQNGKPYIRNPARDDGDPDTAFLPKMIPISPEKARKPGGLWNYSTKMYFFEPIGIYHADLSPEARARLKDTDVNFEVDDAHHPKHPLSPDARKKAAQTKSWIEKKIYEGMQRLVADPAALNGPLTTWIPRVLFLLMPLYAMLLALFYIRQRKTFYYVDHLIFSLTIHTFGFVLLLAAAGAARLIPGNTVATAALVIGGLYTLLATRRFYQQNWFWTVVKFALVSFFYTCFFALPALGVVIVLGFLNV